MQTRHKLAVLELIGGLLGWVWIIASLVAVYFIVRAVFFDGAWSSFFWAAGVAVVAKWLTRGFMENQSRVAHEAIGNAIADAQNLVNRYGAVLASGELISSEEKLPASKAEIKAAFVLAAKATKSAGQSVEQLRVGYASLANFVSPSDAAEAARFQALTSGGPMSDEQLMKVAEGIANSGDALEVQKQATEEFARLVKEFDHAIG